MPRLIAADANSIWSSWLATHPCPANEDGAPCVNDWIFRAAGFCARSGLINANDAADFIRGSLTRREKPTGEVARAVSKQYALPRVSYTVPRALTHKLTFEPRKLELVAKRVPVEIEDNWLAERSPIDPGTVSPGDFLSMLYREGETVAIVTADNNGAPSVLSWLWQHGEELEDLTSNQASGVWFQTNPVDGVDHECEDRRSYRCEAAVTAWRYGVLECDHADYDSLWRKVLVQLPLSIVAIYTSGGRSTHALYRLPNKVTTKPEFDHFVRGPGKSIKNQLVPLGADPNVFRGVQLSRLPACYRGDRLQRLLYLNPNATGVAIERIL